MIDRKLGDYLHNLRINKGRTLRGAAKEMGISAMYLSEIESEKKIPAGQKLKVIADYYQEDYSKLNDIAKRSSPNTKKSSVAAVARMAEILSEEELKKVYEYMEEIAKEK